MPANENQSGSNNQVQMLRALTFGEKACGVSFNPGGNPDVSTIKNHFAVLIDILRTDPTSEEVKHSYENIDTDLGNRLYREENVEKKRMLSIALRYINVSRNSGQDKDIDGAIEHAQTAQMWAVKAVTWQY